MWLPVRARKASHWTQGLVFKHLLGHPFVKGEAKGMGLGLQNQRQPPASPRKAGGKQAVRCQATLPPAALAPALPWPGCVPPELAHLHPQHQLCRAQLRGEAGSKDIHSSCNLSGMRGVEGGSPFPKENGALFQSWSQGPFHLI